MKKPSMRSSLEIALLVGAAAVGVAVLFSVATGQDDGGQLSVRPTPTFTADEVASLSDSLNEADQAANDAIRNKLAADHESVAALKRGEVAGTRLDRPLGASEAIAASSRLVTGIVQDQFLELAPDASLGISRLYLISVVRGGDGTSIRLAQPVAIGRAPAPTLLYDGSQPPLDVGEEYVALAQDGIVDGASLAIRAHVYRVVAGSLRPTADLPESRELAGLTVDEMQAKFLDGRSTAQ